MSDRDLVYSLNEFISGVGSLGIGTVTNESKIRFVVTNAGVSNLIRVRARVNNQPTWVTLIDLTGNINEAIDVFTYDQIEVVTLVYSSLSNNVNLVASSFDGSKVSVSTPNGDISDINTLTLTSSDGSIYISGNNTTGTVDLTAIGGGSRYTNSFVIGDWSGPNINGEYFISIDYVDHLKTNPFIQVYEDSIFEELVEISTFLDDTTNNIVIYVSGAPDLRFNGKVIIS